MVQYLFPRKLKLLNSSHFNFVFQKPQKTRTGCVIILGRLNMLGYPRIGLTVTKRSIKQAHERNRIKRLTRESFRLHQHSLPSMDFVALFKREVINLDNHTFTKVLEKLWHYYYCYFP